MGLLLSSSGPLQAQGSSTIEYPENGEGAVAVFTATDPENMGAVVWSLGGDDAGDFEIDKSSGELSFMKSPNYEMATGGGADGTSSTYSVMVVATDADGVMAEKAVTVEVTNVDEAGKVSLDKVAPYPGVALTATHSDPDGAVSGSEEWQWSRSMSENGSYTDIEDSAEAIAYLPTSGDVGHYLRATVSYEDGEGEGKSAMATSAYQVQAINSPNATPAFPDQDPATAGLQNDAATRMVGENADAGANVGAPVAAEDDDSDILTYTLGDAADGSSFEIDAATGQITVGDDTELDYETKSTYMVTVIATDPAGESAEIEVTIDVVDDANEPPAITGTVPDSIMEEAQTLLVVDFMAADPDPDNDNRDITWSLSGPDAGDFTITASGNNDDMGALTFKASPNYEMPADADGDNVYEVTVSATDADSNRGEKSVEVKVANVDEGGTVTLSAVQPRVGVSLTASLTDPDGGVSDLKWQWANGGTAIDGATSDTYTPTAEDLNGRLAATASYTDAEGAEKMADFAYTNDVAADTRNKAPKFADQDDGTEGDQNTEAERTIAENSAAGISLGGGDPLAATDPNADDDLTYTLGGPDASSFAISSVDATEGQITVEAGTKLDFETKSTYMVTVIATDSFGVSASINVTIKVTDENEGPAVTGPAEAEYAENRTGAVAMFTAVDPENMGAVVWSLGGDDGDDFKIDKSSGVLSFMKSPNYEDAKGGGADGTSNTYSVTVMATDADGIMSEKAVTVEVTDVDEAGTVSLDKVAPYPSVELTATLSDPDGAVSGSEEWQWSRSRSKNGSYPDIKDAKMAAYTPTSGDVGYYLRATVSYKDGEGDGKSAKATSANQVQSINEPNDTPAFPDQDPATAGLQNDAATRMVGENADAGANVGAPVVAEDDDGDILTYTLGGTDVDSFKIDAATGQITVGDDTELDYETKISYMVTVTATDPAGVSDAGVSDAIGVTINVVDDANEPPAITGTVPDSIMEETQTLLVVDFTAVDPDPDSTNMDITWSLRGPDAGDFTITASGNNDDMGALTFKASPNYEMPADADGDNVYEVTVAATDADSNRGEMSVEVKVANEDEGGIVTVSAVLARVGVSLTASLTDIDGGVSDLTWQWTNGGTAIDGATSDTYTPTAENLNGRLAATASYTDAQGPGKMADFAYTNDVAADTRNKAPEFPDQDDKTEGTQNTEAERTIAENSDAGTALNGGGPVAATDVNDGDRLTYTLGGPDASSFAVSSVDATEGQITVGAGTKLDFEAKSTYMVKVIATDSFGATASIDVTITVTDVNEGPEIMRAPDANVAPEFASATTSRTVAENTAAGEDIGNPVAANDANGDALTYTLGGTDAASFAIDSDTGQLMTLAALDYEAKDTYSVTVTASDSGGLSDSIDVTITVTNVEEVGGDSLLGRYDADKDGWIQLKEARAAVGDYFAEPKGDKLSLADTRKVVGLYFEYKNSQ